MHSLNEEERDAVHSLGFGGLFHMKLTENPRSILPFLVDKFDPQGSHFYVFEMKEFVMTAEDIYDVVCLPLNKGNKVVELSTVKDKEKNPDTHYKQEWRRLFGFDDSIKSNDQIPLKLLRERLDSRMYGNIEEFKRFFVMYAMSSFLAPTANCSVDFRITKAIQDVARIPELDWCSYVLDRLCEGIRRYKESEDNKSVSACVMALEICYLHRFMFKGEEQVTALPLIQHWTDDKLSLRLKLEARAGFGKALMDRKTFPISKRRRPQPSNDLFHDQRGKKHITFELPDGISTDEEIASIAKTDIEKTALLWKRDIEVVSNYRMKELLQKTALDAAGASRTHETPMLSQESDYIFSHEKIADYIDDVVLRVLAGEIHGHIPPYNVNLDSPNATGTKENQEGGVGTSAPPKVHSVVTETLNSLEQQKRSRLYCEFDPNAKKEEDLGCSLDCGQKGVKLRYSSETMRKDQPVMTKLPQLFQEVADYCFYDGTDTDKREVILSYTAECQLLREDLLTLSANKHVSSNIIESWSLLLNHVELTNPTCPLRFYFGVDHSEVMLNIIEEGNSTSLQQDCFDAFERWLGLNSEFDINMAEMIFVPLYMEERYSVVVMNFKDESVEYLDNLEYSSLEADYYQKKVCVTVRDMMSLLLQRVKHPKQEKVRAFKCHLVALDWQTKKDNIDNAVYTMIHMMKYSGFKMDCHLKLAAERRRYRAEICAALVLCDKNTQRSTVLERMEEFKKEKERTKKRSSKALQDEGVTKQPLGGKKKPEQPKKPEDKKKPVGRKKTK